MRLGRGVLVALVAGAAAVALAEVGVRLAGYDRDAVEGFLRGAVDEMTGTSVEELAETEEEGSRFPYVLHPYVGFDAAVGGRVLDDCLAWHRAPDRGEKRSVLLLGGSVAALFDSAQSGGSARLVERLEEAGWGGDGRGEGGVEVFRFAQGGYKQPQQLLWLSYLLSLGLRPDVVVNLDGYNEVALTLRNVMSGVRFDHPSVGHWAHLAQGGVLDRAGVELLSTAYDARERAVDRATAALDGGWTQSALLGTWVERRCRGDQAAWGEAADAYVAHLIASRTQARPREWSHDTALVRAVDAWRDSSRAMDALCAAHGVRYLHALQPTLDDAGSKPLSRAEEPFAGDGAQSQRVAEGYGLLRERGAELVAAGVDFVDLSMLFADVRGTVYVDRAHYNPAGNARLAEALAAALLE